MRLKCYFICAANTWDIIMTSILKFDRESLNYDAYEPDRDSVLQTNRCTKHLKGYNGPVLVISKKQLRGNVARFRSAMPNVRPHYAVKANPNKEVLQEVLSAGSFFEVASISEIDLMLDLNVDMETVLYSNPVKSVSSIRHAAKAGLIWYSVDCAEEVKKIASLKSDAKLYLRIKVCNEGSIWPLSGKFGADSNDTGLIIRTAKELDVKILGVTFHVGSQCTNLSNWTSAIKMGANILRELSTHGFKPEMLNVGGGYPLQIDGTEPTIEDIGRSITKAVNCLPPDIQVLAEPGRFFAGSAGYLVTQVVGIANRSGKRWVYLDAGIYGGLMELKAEFPISLVSERFGEQALWTVAGPTCDSLDVMGEKWLPKHTQVNDLIYIPNMGAYSTSCATSFNGFPPPTLSMIN